MAFLDFLFGSQEQKQELPEWYTNAAQSNISRAQDIAEMGYTPYYGVDVAGFTPMQQAAMGNTAQAAGAYGLSAPTNAMSGMGTMVTDPVTGIQGYRSGDIFDQARNELKQRAPAQYDYYNSMIIDPVTGDYGSRTRGGEALGLLNQMGVDTTGINANSYTGSSGVSDARTDEERYKAALASLIRADKDFNWKQAMLPGGILAQLGDRLFAGINRSYVDKYLDSADNLSYGSGSVTGGAYTPSSGYFDESGYTTGNVYNTADMSPQTLAGLSVVDKYNDGTFGD